MRAVIDNDSSLLHMKIRGHLLAVGLSEHGVTVHLTAPLGEGLFKRRLPRQADISILQAGVPDLAERAKEWFKRSTLLLIDCYDKLEEVPADGFIFQDAGLHLLGRGEPVYILPNCGLPPKSYQKVKGRVGILRLNPDCSNEFVERVVEEAADCEIHPLELTEDLDSLLRDIGQCELVFVPEAVRGYDPLEPYLAASAGTPAILLSQPSLPTEAYSLVTFCSSVTAALAACPKATTLPYRLTAKGRAASLLPLLKRDKMMGEVRRVECPVPSPNGVYEEHLPFVPRLVIPVIVECKEGLKIRLKEVKQRGGGCTVLIEYEGVTGSYLLFDLYILR